MNELKSNKKFRPPNKTKDSAGLAALVGMLNAHVGVKPPKDQLPAAAEAVKVAPTVVEPTRITPVTSPAPAAPVNINKVVFTGRLMSGKDFAAEQAGLKVFSIAEPLYALQKLFFGTDDKTIPGAREFLQTAGQIGRNEISAAYPLSIERANFIALVREKAHRDLIADSFSVDWAAYGISQDLWLDAMLLRVRKYLAENPGARVAVTNARFNNELTRLTSEGFVHFHVLTSAQTWIARLKQVGLTPESPTVKDLSEQLSASLDQNVTKTLSQQPQGNKLRAIWSDGEALPPSRRLLTVKEFAALFPKI